MSDDARIGETVKIGDIAERMRRRMEDGRTAHEEWHRERVADGVTRFGWSPDASCGNCGDTGFWPKSMYTCSCPAGGAVVREREERQRQERRQAVWDNVGIPKRFRGWQLGSHPNTEAALTVLDWSNALDGSNLYLTGPVGTGKTGLAIGALRAAWDDGASSLRFRGVPDLLDAMRPGAPEPDPLGECVGCGLLALDDLGVERPSEWVRERLYVLVNGRWEAERPTIVTSNCDLAALADAIGERTVSRLAESVAVVMLDGDDLRRR